MELSITIDNKKFTLLSKISDNDRIFLNINCEYDGGKNDFYIYKSNSQGMWRYLPFIKGKIFKGDDYTTTTMIDFELQNFINENIDNIPYDDYTYKDIEENLKDINMAELKFFFTGREEFVPEFEMIWYLSNIRSNNISKNELAAYLRSAYQHIKSKNNSNAYKEHISDQLYDYYIKQIYEYISKDNIKKDNIKKDNIKKYDLLKIISEQLEKSFQLDDKPTHIYTFDKEIFMFENAKIIKGDIIHNAGNNNNKVQTKKNTKLRSKIYPFSENIDIYSINISYKDSYKQNLKEYNAFDPDVKYKVYYMKYKIVDDKKTYYMPLLVTPENTTIDIYGMPDKYVKTGIFCNKPWDYTNACFYKTTQKTAKKINRCIDTYAFIGNNYRAIWPWNQPIITGEESIILESANNNNLPSSNISNISKNTNIVIEDVFICNTNKIGKGGFGYVYKCYDKEEEQNFAIKFTTRQIKKSIFGKKEPTNVITKEEDMLNKIFYDKEGHPLEDSYENNHIVKYYKLNDKEKEFLTSFFNGRQKAKNIPKYPITLNSILKFEYCQEDLFHFIDYILKKDNFIDKINITNFSKTNKDTIKIDFKNQVFDGLNYLFDRRIVHFDIKKENILVSYYPTNDIITPIYKISDFGSSAFNTFKNEKLNLIYGTYDYLPIYNYGILYKFYPLCFTTYGRDLYQFFRCIDTFYNIYINEYEEKYVNPEFPDDKKYFNKFGKESVSVDIDFINTSKIRDILSQNKPFNDLTEKEYKALYKEIKDDFDKELRDLTEKSVKSTMFQKFVNTETGEEFGFF